jgi:hypothetical protein
VLIVREKEFHYSSFLHLALTVLVRDRTQLIDFNLIMSNNSNPSEQALLKHKSTTHPMADVEIISSGNDAENNNSGILNHRHTKK